MPQTEVIFKPKYTGSIRFAIFLYPIWAVLFLYFLYEFFATQAFNPQGFLAIIFGLMTIALPFRVFREIRFADQLIVKRYLLPDLVIPYKEIRAFNTLEIKTEKTSVPLLMMTPNSFSELEQILQKRLGGRKIKLKKK